MDDPCECHDLKRCSLHHYHLADESCDCTCPPKKTEWKDCRMCGLKVTESRNPAVASKDWFVACEHLNDIANVANHLNEPMHDLGTRWAYDTLWAAAEAIRGDIFGPHDNQWPFNLPGSEPESVWEWRFVDGVTWWTCDKSAADVMAGIPKYEVRIVDA